MNLVSMDPELKIKYALVSKREKITISSTNEKIEVVKTLLNHFNGEEDRILIIGQYIEQLENS